MKKSILSFFAIASFLTTYAQDNSITQQLDTVFKKYTQWFVDIIFYEIPLTNSFHLPWVVLFLIGSAIFFTFYFKFINFSEFKTAIKIVKGDYNKFERISPDNDNSKIKSPEGEVSHFQALATALSATVGLGNIAGVGVAISIGGPGATFWMVIGGLLGMATKFAECTLGVKYRDIGPDGTVYGGPMYYIKKGLAERGFVNLGRTMGFAFALLVTLGAFGIGNMFQANQASVQFAKLIGQENTHAVLWIGALLAIIVALVIVGGIKRIAKVTEKLVPFMAIVYIASALIILGINYHHIGSAFKLIFEGAFTGVGIAGGVAGVMIQGIRRSTFSNEAGIGSAPIAHSAVKTNHPASEGLVALLEPFIDTVIICTMTALIIIIANFDSNIVEYGVGISEGVQVTAAAFDAAIPHFSVVLTIAVILFAVSTMISWSYYGLQGFMYLFGRSQKVRLVYNVIFCIGIWIGSAISLDAVINFSDALIFSMAIPNIIGIVILLPVIKNELAKYRAIIGR